MKGMDKNVLPLFKMSSLGCDEIVKLSSGFAKIERAVIYNKTNFKEITNRNVDETHASDCSAAFSKDTSRSDN